MKRATRRRETVTTYPIATRSFKVKTEDFAAKPATSGLDLLLADGGRLAVESVLTLAGDLAVQPLSARLRRFLPPGSSGLAMHAGEPIVLMLRGDDATHV